MREIGGNIDGPARPARTAAAVTAQCAGSVNNRLGIGCGYSKVRKSLGLLMRLKLTLVSDEATVYRDLIVA